MKLFSTFFVLYGRNCPKDDKFWYFIPILRKLGAAYRTLVDGSLESPHRALVKCNWILFTARRFASAVLATAIPSVRLFVCLSVTRRYCVKTTARSTVQFALSDSKMCPVLSKPENIPQRRPLPVKSSLDLTYPLLIAASLDTFCLQLHLARTWHGLSNELSTKVLHRP